MEPYVFYEDGHPNKKKKKKKNNNKMRSDMVESGLNATNEPQIPQLLFSISLFCL